ncbi:Mediator complex subunit Med27 [Trinorchestia longiramus]|nr:Mediator complex subunit Med27 [Trinorchestia longiramus]
MTYLRPDPHHYVISIMTYLRPNPHHYGKILNSSLQAQASQTMATTDSSVGGCNSVPGSNRPDPNSNASTVPAAPTPEQLAACLKYLRAVRGSATQFFAMLAQQGEDNESGNSSSSLFDLNPKKDDKLDTENKVQTMLDELMTNVKTLQNEVSSLSPIMGSSTQSNLDLLSLDPATDKQQLHHQLRQCYIWMDKVYNYSTMSHLLIGHSHLNRSQMPNQLSASKRRRTPALSCNVNVPQLQVDSLIQTINKQFQDMTLTVSRPMGSNAIVQVTLGRLLRGVMTLRGLLIEGVVIRGYYESYLDQHGREDIFKPSQLAVFQRVTDNASAAMLHFCSPYLADLSIRSFFTWLHSFSNLFTEPCTKCNCTVSNNSPPTWREFRTLLPYHQHCRP